MRFTPPLRRLGLVPILCALLLALPAPGHRVAAQEELPAVPLDSLSPGRPQVSPGGAFLRAVVLPGWGHAAIGSYTRGAVYFAAEAATAFGLVRTRLRLSEAEDRLALQESFRRETLIRDGVTDPEELQTALDEDEVLSDLRGLVSARQQQQEDWAALGIFLVLLSGADAYVSAHLQDFPTPLDLNVTPLPGGRAELSVGVRLPLR
jgi:hypothetical protein